MSSERCGHEERALDGLSEAELVDSFMEIALAQGEALIDEDTRKYNRLFERMEKVEAPLQARDGDGRRALVSLFGHWNRHIRMKAAMATMAPEPEAARRMLRSIIDGREFPEALYAGMFLRRVDDGSYKPAWP